jgi:REP element-mobilizing transposase RayT
MPGPRYKQIIKGEEAVVHCWSQCVRRTHLFGYDPLTKRDYSHRKKLMVDRLKFLASIFAIDVCAFAVLINHLHTVLRIRPDLTNLWSDYQIASRWARLHPQKSVPLKKRIKALLTCPKDLRSYRERLCDLSEFMAELNEYIARIANKEDGCTGHFWEERFHCKVLLDEASIACCMAYVDLNPIRAGIAISPEESDFTSIQERIRAWKDAMQTESWLCPIQSNHSRRGILQMTEADYFDLVDKTGRTFRTDKPGFIDPDLPPMLQRIGAIPETWDKTVSQFESNFGHAVGTVSSLRKFANRLGKKWLKGISFAKKSFT